MTANTAPPAETDSSPRAPHSSRRPHSSRTPQTIALTGPWRWVISSMMALTGIFLLKQTLTVDWGVEAMLASLAIPLLIVSIAAMRRRALVLDESGECWLETGFIWRRRWRLPMGHDDLAVELTPTAGTVALLLYIGEAGRPLGTWLSPQRAAAGVDLLEQAAGRSLPRREPKLPDADRYD